MPRGMQIVQEEELEGAESVWEIEKEDWAMTTVMNAAENLEPPYNKVKKWLDWPRWKEAIHAELRSLEANGTWVLADRPKDANVISSKWVLRIKKNAAGEVEKYKARLVARGFTQIYGVDYHETYAPVACLASFRMLLAMANRNQWPANSFDFDSAYLNSVLSNDKGCTLNNHQTFQWEIHEKSSGYAKPYTD